MQTVSTPPTDSDAQLIIFDPQTTFLPTYYKQYKSNSSQLLVPSIGSPVAHKLKFQKFQKI